MGPSDFRSCPRLRLVEHTRLTPWTPIMARLPRIEFADIPQHVVQRGNDRQPCFLDEADYRRYLRGLQEAAPTRVASMRTS